MRVEQPYASLSSDGPFADEPPLAVEQFDPHASDFDARRQGVEIRLAKHFDRGAFKVLSGEPGHAAMRGGLGLGAERRWTPLVDAGTLDPVQLLTAVTGSEIVTGVDDPDGRLAALGSCADRISARASVSGQQSDSGAAELIAEVHAKRSKRAGSASVDSSDRVVTLQAEATVEPFADCSSLDALLFGRAFAPSETPGVDVEVLAALELMRSSRDNALVGDDVSLARGFTYDSPIGLDSIAFGDRTRR